MVLMADVLIKLHIDLTRACLRLGPRERLKVKCFCVFSLNGFKSILSVLVKNQGDISTCTPRLTLSLSLWKLFRHLLMIFPF